VDMPLSLALDARLAMIYCTRAAVLGNTRDGTATKRELD
jgi:hypothetical protein